MLFIFFGFLGGTHKLTILSINFYYNLSTITNILQLAMLKHDVQPYAAHQNGLKVNVESDKRITSFIK